MVLMRLMSSLRVVELPRSPSGEDDEGAEAGLFFRRSTSSLRDVSSSLFSFRSMQVCLPACVRAHGRHRRLPCDAAVSNAAL